MKVIAMTTTTTTKFRYPYTLWISSLAVFRHLNKELTGAGEAMARSNRGPQAGLDEAEIIRPAYAHTGVPLGV
jgi:hypothetical protein